jgi:hypothetical protein
MNQIERVHMHLSNLITGIAGVGASIQTAASGKNWWTIRLKTRCLRRQSRGTNRAREPMCSATGVQYVSVPNGLEGKNFEIKRGIRKYSDSKFRFLICQ